METPRRNFVKGDRVQFWDFVDRKFVLKNGIITKIRKLKPFNYKILTDEGEVFFKWKPKIELFKTQQNGK